MAEPPALDPPVAGLGDAEALAKAWLLELIAARPLGEAARLRTERLGADGPALVAAAIGALLSQPGLARPSPGGDLRRPPAAARALARARGPLGAVAPPRTAPGAV